MLGLFSYDSEIAIDLLYAGRYEEVGRTVNRRRAELARLSGHYQPRFDHLAMTGALLANKDYEGARICIMSDRNGSSALLDQYAHGMLALAWRGLKQTLAFREHLHLAIDLHNQARSVTSLWIALPAAALLAIDDNRLESAVELYALAMTMPAVAGSPFIYDIAGREIEERTAEIDPELVAAAEERGLQRDVWETAAELLTEIKAAQGGSRPSG